MSRVVELRLTVPVEPWRRMGFSPVDSPRGPLIRVPDVDLCFSERPGSEAISGWAIAHDDGRVGEVSIDGIVTSFVPTVVDEVARPADPLSITGVDHIVINTGSIDRTCAVIERELGLPLKRTRDAGNGVRQGFHRAGPVIIEVVERPDLPQETPASLWGLVFNVRDLDSVVAWLGPDVIGAAKEATQPGRRIATFRSGAGLVVPMALMTPETH